MRPKLILNEPENKAEETEFLKKIVEFMRGKDLYLSQLLNDNLLAWFDEHIRADFPCDIYIFWREAVEDAFKFEKERNELSFELKELQERYSQLVSENEKKENDYFLMKKECESKLHEAYTEIDELRRKLELYELEKEEKELLEKLNAIKIRKDELMA